MTTPNLLGLSALSAPTQLDGPTDAAPDATATVGAEPAADPQWALAFEQAARAQERQTASTEVVPQAERDTVPSASFPQSEAVAEQDDSALNLAGPRLPDKPFEQGPIDIVVSGNAALPEQALTSVVALPRPEQASNPSGVGSEIVADSREAGTLLQGNLATSEEAQPTNPSEGEGESSVSVAPATLEDSRALTRASAFDASSAEESGQGTAAILDQGNHRIDPAASSIFDAVASSAAPAGAQEKSIGATPSLSQSGLPAETRLSATSTESAELVSTVQAGKPSSAVGPGATPLSDRNRLSAESSTARDPFSERSSQPAAQRELLGVASSRTAPAIGDANAGRVPQSEGIESPTPSLDPVRLPAVAQPSGRVSLRLGAADPRQPAAGRAEPLTLQDIDSSLAAHASGQHRFAVLVDEQEPAALLNRLSQSMVQGFERPVTGPSAGPGAAVTVPGPLGLSVDPAITQTTPSATQSSSPAQSLALTLQSQQQLGEDLGRMLANVRHTSPSSLSVTLYPEELGRLDIRVNSAGDQSLSIQILAQQPQARELLDAQLGRLRSALQDGGFNAVDVDIGDASDRESQDQPSRQRANVPPSLPGSVPETHGSEEATDFDTPLSRPQNPGGFDAFA